MGDVFCTLGTFAFRSDEITLGARERTIQVNGNCLAAEPVQTVAYYGYQPIRIHGYVIGEASTGETAVECLRRLRHNLETEVAKDANTLTIDWGDGSPETYRVFRNPDFDRPLSVNIRKTNHFEFDLTLTCLPT